MLILDSDHMSLLEWGGSDSFPLRERLADCDPQEVVTTIINYEEQIRGWMAYIAKARSVSQQVEAYRRLRSHLDNDRQIPVMDFDDTAGEIYQQLRRSRIRVGAMDLKIAAIAIARKGTLLSRNRQDFDRIPGLQIEDWTT